MKKLVIVVFTILALAACKDNLVTPESTIQTDASIASDAELNNLIITADTIVTDAEIQSLLYMREEEKLAGDVYKHFSRLFNLREFSNIAKSEERHADVLVRLLKLFNIPDPALAEGKFTNTVLQALYDKLTSIQTSDTSLAVKTGLMIEELDIKDIQDRLKTTVNKNIIRVYLNLIKGSQNHLRAFYKLAVLNDITYVPSYITQAEFDDIIKGINSNGNKGNKTPRGNGKGRK